MADNELRAVEVILQVEVWDRRYTFVTFLASIPSDLGRRSVEGLVGLNGRKGPQGW